MSYFSWFDRTFNFESRIHVRGVFNGSASFTVRVRPNFSHHDVLAAIRNKQTRYDRPYMGSRAHSFVPQALDLTNGDQAAIFVPANNSSQLPILFWDEEARISVCEQNKPITSSFIVRVNNNWTVSELRGEILRLQQVTQDFGTYGHGVLHIVDNVIYATNPGVLPSPAPGSKLLINIVGYSSNGDSNPLLFAEDPNAPTAMLTPAVLNVLQRAVRANTTSSARSAGQKPQS